jgi:hypothetical protein
MEYLPVAERQRFREEVFMLVALVSVGLLVVVGLTGYVLYLTPNPKDPI